MRICFIFILLMVTLSTAIAEVDYEWLLDEQMERELGEDLKQQDKKEIQNVDFDNVDQLYQASDIEIQKELRKEDPKRKHRAVFGAPEQFPAVLMHNSILLNVKSKKQFTTPRKVFVKAIQKEFRSKVTYILSKDGEILYETKTVNVIPLDNDLDLLPFPKTYETYPPKSQLLTNDKTFKFSNVLSLHYEYMDLSYLQEAFSSDSAQGQGTTVGFKTFYQWLLPLEFGLSINYQEGQWQNEALGHPLWTALYIGPSLRYPVMNQVFAILSAQTSLFHKIQSNDGELKISSHSLQLELEKHMKLRFGSFVVGGSYRYLRAALQSGNNGSTLPPEPGTASSLGVYIGYNLNLEI